MAIDEIIDNKTNINERITRRKKKCDKKISNLHKMA